MKKCQSSLVLAAAFLFTLEPAHAADPQDLFPPSWQKHATTLVTKAKISALDLMDALDFALLKANVHDADIKQDLQPLRTALLRSAKETPKRGREVVRLYGELIKKTESAAAAARQNESFGRRKNNVGAVEEFSAECTRQLKQTQALVEDLKSIDGYGTLRKKELDQKIFDLDTSLVRHGDVRPADLVSYEQVREACGSEMNDSAACAELVYKRRALDQADYEGKVQRTQEITAGALSNPSFGEGGQFFSSGVPRI